MQTLYPNVPKYGEVPRGVSDSQMLASLEGRQPQQPQMPLIGKTAPVEQPQQAPVAPVVANGQPAYQSPSAEDTARDVATNTATNFATQQAGNAINGANTAAQAASYGETAYGATEAALGLNQAADAALMYDAAGNAIGTSAAGSLGSGSGILGANGATLGSAGVGLAALPVAALYGYQVPRTYANLTSEDSEKKWQGATEAALLASGAFAWAAPLASLGFDIFDTGKPEDQQQRDNVRQGLQQTGIMTENYEFELPNGQLYYAGKDGSTPEYQVQNPDRPLTGRVIGAAQVMAAIMVGQPGKAAEDLTGQLTNMALSNATTYEDAMNNLMHQFTKFVTSSGLTPQAARDEIASWVNEGLIDQQAAEAYLAAHNSFLEGNPWQFTNEAANAPLQEGQAAPPAATFQFDPAANLRPGASPGSSPMPTAPQSTGPTSTGPRPVTAPQAPRMAPARGAGPLPTQGPIKNLTPGTTPTAAASMTGTQRSIPPHIQEILLRVR